MNHSCVGTCAKAISRRYQRENGNIGSSVCLVMCRMLTVFTAGFPFAQNTERVKHHAAVGVMTLPNICVAFLGTSPSISIVLSGDVSTPGDCWRTSALNATHLVSPPLVPHPPLSLHSSVTACNCSWGVLHVKQQRHFFSCSVPDFQHMSRIL